MLSCVTLLFSDTESNQFFIKSKPKVIPYGL